MTELQKRILSSLVLVPIVLFCLWSGGWVYRALVLLVMIGLVWEGESLLGQRMKTLRGVLLMLWPLCAGLIAIKGQWLAVASLVGASLLFGLPTCGPVLVSIFGGIALLWLRSRPEGLYETLFVIFAVIASDSCAYATGRLIGGPKLAPAISPGKTISGSIGGIIGAVVMGGVIAHAAVAGWSVSACLMGGILAIAAQCGDLMESAFKRRLGVKDSGKLIPGHGGLLDRLDALLLAAPIAALCALCSGQAAFWTLF